MCVCPTAEGTGILCEACRVRVRDFSDFSVWRSYVRELTRESGVTGCTNNCFLHPLSSSAIHAVNPVNAMKGGVVWTRGHVKVSDGIFRRNTASSGGGVVFASDESSVALRGGNFTWNYAEDGGVALVDSGGTLLVEGSECSENVAVNDGGVFFSSHGGHLKVGVHCYSL